MDFFRRRRVPRRAAALRRALNRPHDLTRLDWVLSPEHGGLHLAAAADADLASYATLVIENLRAHLSPFDLQMHLELQAQRFSLTVSDVAPVHEELVRELGRLLVSTGEITTAEERELAGLAVSLGLTLGRCDEILQQVRLERLWALNMAAQVLPANWAHGTPLHVGDEVVLVGEMPGDSTEAVADEMRLLGLRVSDRVTASTDAVVWDGTDRDARLDAALDLSTRLIPAESLPVMLQYLQPQPGPEMPAST